MCSMNLFANPKYAEKIWIINDCFLDVCIVPNSFPDPKTPKNSALNAKDMENWVSAINSKIFFISSAAN